MKASRIISGAALAVALALPGADARACGNGPMPMAMTGPAAVMAAAAPIVAVGVALPAIGATVSVLPQGYLTVAVNGASFYRAGPTWYQPLQGPGGPMYRVVPAPHGM